MAVGSRGVRETGGLVWVVFTSGCYSIVSIHDTCIGKIQR